mmetsp:Transcript_454/g.820  ORF Transcript_454/g.820 Transcript_454/m.820 type:complete len:275 (+) Transcript_454:1115-1939(+)
MLLGRRLGRRVETGEEVPGEVEEEEADRPWDTGMRGSRGSSPRLTATAGRQSTSRPEGPAQDKPPTEEATLLPTRATSSRPSPPSRQARTQPSRTPSPPSSQPSRGRGSRAPSRSTSPTETSMSPSPSSERSQAEAPSTETSRSARPSTSPSRARTATALPSSPSCPRESRPGPCPRRASPAESSSPSSSSSTSPLTPPSRPRTPTMSAASSPTPGASTVMPLVASGTWEVSGERRPWRGPRSSVATEPFWTSSGSIQSLRIVILASLTRRYKN